MHSLFCRHNRFTADCPICSKGTPVDASPPARLQRTPTRSASGKQRAPRTRPSAPERYPYVGAGPYDRDDKLVEVRLERVPGGLRLGEWAGGALCQHAPRLAAADVASLVTMAHDQGVIEGPAAQRLVASVQRRDAETGQAGPDPFAKSPGRAGDLWEELRVERLTDDDPTVRIARWMLVPATGWQMRDAPTLFAPARYAEAFAAAVQLGLVAPAGVSDSR